MFLIFFKEHICGGVILDAITILSAAHCFYGSGELEMHQGKTGKEFANLEKFSVFADIIYNNGSAGQVKKKLVFLKGNFVFFPIIFFSLSKKKIREIEKFIWNNEEEYNSETKENDIIILKLNKPLLLDENRVQPACLPTDLWPIRNRDNFTNECFVSGWGRTSNTCKIFFENNYFPHSN